jgi:hypothetical protein
MKKEYIVELREEEADELMDEHWVGELVRCKDCKHWDKTTREKGIDCISGKWEDAECSVFRDWDTYGELGDQFRRTCGNWFCAAGERRDDDGRP